MCKFNNIFFLIFGFTLLFSCRSDFETKKISLKNTKHKIQLLNNGSEDDILLEEEVFNNFNFTHDSLIFLTELLPCDILVKPNHNWLYGTSLVEGGSGFGHAVMVVEGSTGKNTLEVLQKAKIFESQAHKLPNQFQLRLAPGFLDGDDYRWANTNFGNQIAGYRYRLRLNLSHNQRDSIIQYILAQDEDISSWRSQKLFRKKGLSDTDFLRTANQKKTWYCSLLVWEAFYSVLGIDLDSNGGLMVYPNDLINSSYFEKKFNGHKKRVRF